MKHENFKLDINKQQDKYGISAEHFDKAKTQFRIFSRCFAGNKTDSCNQIAGRT